MNKQELQEKLDALLLGHSAYNMYKLCNAIETNAIKWFRDSQGYIGARLNSRSITITYKGRGLVHLDIKVRKDNVHGWAVKQVIIDENFIDTETSINAIHERFKKEYEDKIQDVVYGSSLDKSIELLKGIKTLYPNMTAGEIKYAIYALHQRFWNAEEML